MKRSLAGVILALLCALAFAACGASDGTKSEPEARTGTVDLAVYVGSAPLARDWETFNLAIAPRVVDYQLWYSDFNEPIIKEGAAKQAEDQGAALLIGWKPTTTMKEVAEGGADKEIEAAITAVKAYKGPLIIRLAWEPNGNWYPYGFGYETAAEYIEGWKYVVDKFAEAEVSNVEWCWNVSNYDEFDKTVTDPSPYYPGDSYVDILGIDGYSVPEFPTTPEEIFQPTLEILEELSGLKVFICETGASPDEEGHDKSAWFTELGEWIEGTERIWALGYFNVEWEGGDDTIDSSDADPGAREAFSAVVNDSPFAKQ